MDAVEKTREFVKRSFQENPNYSFNDWHVMYDHSVMVQEIALQIAENMECDKILVAIGALLHDIGKTMKEDTNILHKKHAEFNLKASEKFLDSLDLGEKSTKLKEIVSYRSDSTEMKIIKDADTLAFYKDKRLQKLFFEWANGMPGEAERKLAKFEKLNFDVSKKIGKVWFEETKSVV